MQLTGICCGVGQRFSGRGGVSDGFTQTWGDPNTEATRGFFNAGLPISDSVEVYAFGNYSDSERDGVSSIVIRTTERLRKLERPTAVFGGRWMLQPADLTVTDLQGLYPQVLRRCN